MQIQIPLHAIDNEFRAAHDQRLDVLRESLPRLHEASRTQVDSLPDLADAAHACAAFHYVHDPEATQVIGALRLCQEALVALFASAGTPGATTRFVGLADVTYAQKPPAAAINIDRWLDAYFLSLIIGDLDAMQLLCAFPGATLRASPTPGAGHRHALKEALRAWLAKDADVIRPIAAAIIAAIDEPAEPLEKLEATALAVPQLNVFRYIAERNEVKFNGAMWDAVEEHKRFWSRSPDSARDPRGFISLELTGLLAMAAGAGLACGVRTPYLPRHLIREPRSARPSP